MKALIQRVKRGSVTVGENVAGRIERGYVVLLGVKNGDAEQDATYLAEKTVNLRIFPDAEDRMNLSVRDIEGSILVVSQFTLCADAKKGNRPSFVQAAPPEIAERLYNVYVEHLGRLIGNERVATGVFGGRMAVEIVNDGPVTILLET